MNEFIRYALRCVKRAKSQKFRQQVLDIGNQSRIQAELQSAGNAHRGEAIYSITVGSESLGFFALFREMLFYLAFADHFGLYPVVSFCEGNLYQESDAMYGTRNVFEYYFDQPGAYKGLRIDEITHQASLVIPSSTDHYLKAMELNGLSNCNNYQISKAYFELFASMIRKYISINELTQAKLDQDLAFLNDTEWIGVHYRGGDYKANYKGHPKSLELNDVIRTVHDMVDCDDSKKIFLATDDIAAIEKFNCEFGKKVYSFEDVRRTDGIKGVHTTTGVREHDKYLLGYEVLRDMYALSKCKALVSGVSQVSMCAKMFKLSRGEDYEKHILIDTGINTQGKAFSL